MTETIDVLSLEDRLAITSTGRHLQITQMLDCYGDETDDPDEAVAAIAPDPGHGWWTICVADFDFTATIH